MSLLPWGALRHIMAIFRRYAVRTRTKVMTDVDGVASEPQGKRSRPSAVVSP